MGNLSFVTHHLSRKQSAEGTQDTDLAGDVLKVPENRVRVVAGDIGGSWRMALTLSALALAALIIIFDSLVHVLWPEPAILEWLGIEL